MSYIYKDGDGVKKYAKSTGAGTSDEPTIPEHLCKDGGPSQAVTRKYVTSADMTTAADISNAPDTGKMIIVMDIIVSTDTEMSFTIQEETSATVFAKVYLAARSTTHIRPRGYLKTATADKKLQGKASMAGNVAITSVYFSE